MLTVARTLRCAVVTTSTPTPTPTPIPPTPTPMPPPDSPAVSPGVSPRLSVCVAWRLLIWCATHRCSRCHHHLCCPLRGRGRRRGLLLQPGPCAGGCRGAAGGWGRLGRARRVKRCARRRGSTSTRPLLRARRTSYAVVRRVVRARALIMHGAQVNPIGVEMRRASADAKV
jgi:hypothetical protein